jgi:hypothetical protein
MKWKIWLAAFAILAIAGLLVISRLKPETFDPFNKLVGRFASAVNLPFKPSSGSGDYFAFTLEGAQDSFAGNTWDTVNASLSIEGNLAYLKTNTQVMTMTGNSVSAIEIKDLTGKFELLGNGVAVVSGKASSVQIDDYYVSSDKSLQIALEITPTKFMLSDLQKDKLVLNSANGMLTRITGGRQDLIKVVGSKIEIDYFIGSLKMENTTSMLFGVSKLIKGPDFTLTA